MVENVVVIMPAYNAGKTIEGDRISEYISGLEVDEFLPGLEQGLSGQVVCGLAIVAQKKVLDSSTLLTCPPA